ncbi:MAG: C-GCAxxG-C-C family protein [Firmicutes bacterium]|nr:C-GCAxxG-C-C family protein [Bacillota bacterium]
MSQVETAVACFENGFSCSQAVFSTYAKSLGLDGKTALQIAGAFGGGMGHIGEACGAVTGAFMAIGLKYGKFKPDDDAAKAQTYQLVQEFTRRFKARHGSVSCKELLKLDLSIPEELKKAQEEGVFRKLCPGYVQTAAEILEEIL